MSYKTDPKVDTKVDPASLELAVGEDRSPALYQIKGDELTISVPYTENGPPPPDLKPRAGYMTIKFKRVEKGK